MTEEALLLGFAGEGCMVGEVRRACLDLANALYKDNPNYN